MVEARMQIVRLDDERHIRHSLGVVVEEVGSWVGQSVAHAGQWEAKMPRKITLTLLFELSSPSPSFEKSTRNLRFMIS
jgi:hypothetical protein